MEALTPLLISLLLKIWGLTQTIITIVRTYFNINKSWSRKHIAEVADSISIYSEGIGLITISVGFLLSVYHLDAAVFGFLLPLMAVVYTNLLGIGYWVNNGLTFKQKFKRAIKMNGKETATIIKDVMNPSGVKKIYEILCEVALVDKVVKPREERLLKIFAEQYHLNYDEIIKSLTLKHSTQSTTTTMYNLKKEIDGYLNTSPPKNIVTLLQDLIVQVIKSDNEVSREEEILNAEINVAFVAYLTDYAQKPVKYNLIVVPQSKDDEVTVLGVNDKLVKAPDGLFGTKTAYIIDSFNSESLAELVREDYVKLFNCFVTVEKF